MMNKIAGEDYDSCVEQVKADGKSEDEAHAICTESVKKESAVKLAFQQGFKEEVQGLEKEAFMDSLGEAVGGIGGAIGGGGAGGSGGAALGATLGSMVAPGIGTAAGAAIGGGLGMAGGGYAGAGLGSNIGDMVDWD